MAKAKVLEVPEEELREVFSSLGFKNAEDVTEKKLMKMVDQLPAKIEDLEEDEDLDLDKKQTKLVEKLVNAVEKDWEIHLLNGEEEEDEEEDEPKAKKGKGKAKKATKEKAKKGKGKAKKAKRSGGGPSTKDKIFEEWMKSKNPSKDVAKIAKRHPEVQEATIRGWFSNWKKGPGDPADGAASYPRIATKEYKDKEIKEVIKRHKKSSKSED